MATEYDEKIFQKHADDLYARAGEVVMSTAVRYGLVSLIASGIMYAMLFRAFPDSPNIGIFLVIVITALGVVAGVGEGRQKALKWRLEAQELLCQRQIELNTRAIMQGRREPNS